MATKKKKKRPYKKKKKENYRYANQQAVYIHKTTSHKKGHYFSMDVSKTNAAMRNLTGSAFKMYVYLCEYMDGHSIFLSGSDFCKATGLSDRSYILAKRELIDKNYLILREDNDFDFYNYPYIPEKPLTKSQQILNEIINRDKEKAVVDQNS